MTATLQVELALQGGAGAHSASIDLPDSAAKEWRRTHALLRDKLGQKHTLLVHAYSRRWETSIPNAFAYEVAVRFSNGAVKRDGSGFCGRVYFDQLSVKVADDEDLMIVAEARAGAFYDAATGALQVARSGGHVFPPRAVLERRLLLVPKKLATAEVSVLRDRVFKFKAVHFANEPWGPAREELPVVHGAHFGKVFRAAAQQASQLVAAGTPGSVNSGGSWTQLDLRVGALGPFIPDGDPEPGAPAGYEIDLAYGWAQCPESLELASIAHECSMARNSVAWFDLDTGEPLGVDDWITSESGRPQLMANGTLELPVFFKAGNYPNFNAGSSPYQGVLEGYHDDDTEHCVRAMDDAAQLACWAGDPMAFDDLRMLFEHHRAMAFVDRSDALPSFHTQKNAGWTKGLDGQPLVPGSPAGTVSWIGFRSLTRDLVDLTRHPHHGSPRFLRHWGWFLTLAVFARATSTVRKMVETFLLAYDRHGIVQREYHEPYMPKGVQGTQLFHNAIDQAAVLRAIRFLNDPILTFRVLDAMHLYRKTVLENPALIQTRADNPGVRGPAKWIFTQLANGAEPDPLTAANTSGGGFQEHQLAVLGLAALCELELDHKAGALEFLLAGLPLEVPHPDLKTRLAWIRSRRGDLSQYASYAAACEKIGVG